VIGGASITEPNIQGNPTLLNLFFRNSLAERRFVRVGRAK
jgi:hypothetical protein